VNVNGPGSVTEPPAVVTYTAPVAPAPTVAIIEVVLATITGLAVTPPSCTDAGVKKFVPVIFTTVPDTPLVGLKPVIVGGARKVYDATLVAVPPGVVTAMVPVAPPEPRYARICVGDITVKAAAATPPMVTADAPVKFVPLMSVKSPAPPDASEKPVIVGADAASVNTVADVAVPPGVVTTTLPVAPPAATTAVICVGVTTKPVAGTPPKVTVAGARKFVPLIVMVAPTGALVGVKLVIVGVGTNVNTGTEVAVPPGVVTTTLPDAPAPTLTVSTVPVLLTIVAGVPPSVTSVALVKFVPVIVTVSPGPALVGVKVVIVGKGMKVNVPDVAVPPGVVTTTLPVEPLAATTAVICVGVTTKPVAGTPPKVTVAGARKFVPLIVMVAPTGALVGVKLVIVGVATHVKVPAEFTVPPGAVTETKPVAPAPTTAVIVVGVAMKLAAGVPPKLTAVAPLKFVPVIVTVRPGPALVGVNVLIVGGEKNVNPVRVPVPPAVVTATLPPTAEGGTTAVICVAETTVKLVASAPPNVTEPAPQNRTPLIVTIVPVLALVGVKLLIVGADTGVIRRMRLLLPSAIYASPPLTTTPVGALNIAAAPVPAFIKPEVPAPASAVTTPDEVIRRIAWLSWSATYRFPPLSAKPVGLLNCAAVPTALM
jgi:hypothetical protein